MKLLLLTVLLLLPQTEPKWIQIKEMSGPIPDYPGLTIETYATQIKRKDATIKLLVRVDFPGGAPRNALKGAEIPSGFDTSSISRVVFRLEMNCDTFTVTPTDGSSDVYQFNGKKHKSKERIIALPSTHVFPSYFCEQGTKPTEAPKLKPTNPGKSVIP